ncbi:probable low-specificity L-threonine aldolase 2 [Ostrinia furnacalis]|uniref:probable low-specificity L-threonine aldolase 2 n=1 Tax=Ostrinia furnacalis TaxID=93504 RepID=UPI00103B5437|nr:probable low-specificity L-threonine aldolase 2 [Ostrinia furnacalis]
MSTQSIVIDLRSDTVTKPTESMKEAMITASLGDDVFGEDPTVNALQAKVADILDKEAALLVPSGTMANLIAAMVHCFKRGSEMLCGDQSHVFKREGGIADLAGVYVTGLKNLPDGTFELDDFEKHVRGSDDHEPITMMVSIENTHSYCGGKVIPLEWIQKLSEIAKKRSVVVHMDGARLFNASEQLGLPPSRLARDCDSVSICLSKGLGAPVGSVLAGTRRFIDQARRYRKMLGGGMRQAGVLAAAGMVALEESVPFLSRDHGRAHYIAEQIKNLKLSTFTVEDMDASQTTNIVHVKINGKGDITSRKVTERLALVSQSETSCKTADGLGIVVLASAKPDSKTVRFVLHHDVNDYDLKHAVKKIQLVLTEIDKNK